MTARKLFMGIAMGAIEPTNCVARELALYVSLIQFRTHEEMRTINHSWVCRTLNEMPNAIITWGEQPIQYMSLILEKTCLQALGIT